MEKKEEKLDVKIRANKVLAITRLKKTNKEMSNTVDTLFFYFLFNPPSPHIFYFLLFPAGNYALSLNKF